MVPSVKLILIGCVFLLSQFSISDSARILGHFITPSKSHLIIHDAIMSALADRGHNVTMITTIPFATRNPNIRHIQLQQHTPSIQYYSTLINTRPPWYHRVYDNIKIISTYTNFAFNDPQMKQLMDEEPFDLVIQGYLFNDFLFGLKAHFKCPIVLSLVVRQIGAINGFVGNPQEAAYVPSLLSGDKQPLGFFNRVKNFVYIKFLEDMLLSSYYEWYQSDIYR
ncbi:UDP-glucosyltransferase 2-like [Episyrphus balteatus]|uniref:UDP-glucosyltransferase 2-like n=1 Tax=Episyrphus balteatus TaxID=286459 RepID=UPI00248613CA|nr:UDP-glucosyltransferase 2-like [Episyrphus balteatus]